MKIFNKFECCRGITLWSLGKKRIEIWFIPSNYKIVEHSHPNENVELMFIFGKTVFYRRNLQTGKVDEAISSWKMFGRCFSVKWNDSHWFSTTSWPLVFINFQTFFNKSEKMSAADDFKIT